MSDATVVGLAKSVTALIQAAINDVSKPLGAGLQFNLNRVSYLKQWVIPDNDEVIRVRVATHGTEGATEESRLAYGVKYVIPVGIYRKLNVTNKQGETIDDDNASVLAMSDQLASVVQSVTQIFAVRPNWEPFVPGLGFLNWTHKDRSNMDGLIFNPAGLSERRQFESVIFLNYRAEFQAL